MDRPERAIVKYLFLYSAPLTLIAAFVINFFLRERSVGESIVWALLVAAVNALILGFVLLARRSRVDS